MALYFIRIPAGIVMDMLAVQCFCDTAILFRTYMGTGIGFLVFPFCRQDAVRIAVCVMNVETVYQ